jgi:ATP-dependent DNA ligase
MTHYLASDLEPMSCDAVLDVASLKGATGDYIMQPKLDGFRIVAVVHEGSVDFMTRGLKWVGERQGDLTHIDQQLRKMFPVGSVIDGEVVALTPNESKANDFEHVQGCMLSLPERSRMLQAERPLDYMVFDIVQLGSTDLRSQPLSNRLMALRMAFTDQEPDNVFRIPSSLPSQEYHDSLVNAGWEGTVCKRLDSKYVFGGRGKGWYKIKATWTMDAIVLGFIEGDGKNKGKVGSIIFGQPTPRDSEVWMKGIGYLKELQPRIRYFDPELCKTQSPRGCARGFDDATMEAMTESPQAFLGRVVEISHNGLMAGGVKVRHPQFLRFRDPSDKPSSTVDWRHR